MNLEETTKLLQLIEGYDRTPFKPAALEIWAGQMRSTVYEDAVAAVHSIFRIAGHDRDGDIRKLLPADVIGPARAIGDARRRKAAQAAISAPAQRLGSVGRPAEVERMLADARAKAEAAAARYREPVAA